MLKVKDVGEFASESRILDGHVIIVEWNKQGKPTHMYWEASETSKSSFQVGLYQNGLVKSIEIILAEHIAPLPKVKYGDTNAHSKLAEGLPVFQIEGKLGEIRKTVQPFYLLIGNNELVVDFEYGTAQSYKYYIKAERTFFGINQKDELSIIRITDLSPDEMKMVRWRYQSVLDS